MCQRFVGFIILLIVPVVGRGDDLTRAAPAPLPTIPIAPQKHNPADVDITNPAWKKATSGEVPKEPAKASPVAPAEDNAKPTDPKKLKEDVEKMIREREEMTKGASGGSATDDERAKLKKQLDDLILKLNKPKPKVEEKKPAQTDPHKTDPVPGGKLLDSMRYGLNKYQEGDVKEALAAFRMANPNTQTGEEKAFTQYFIACCHKQLGQTNEAITIYREITEAKLDPFVTECALGQLGTIRQLRELDAQLEQLRVRRKAK